MQGRNQHALTIVAMLVAGCGAGPAPSPSPQLTAAATPPTSATGSASANAPGASGLSVAVDPGLLAFLPAAVDGLSLTYDPENTARVAADPTLVPQATGLAMAIAVAPGASGSTDLAVASVIRVRDPSAGEAWFRAWRDSYDQAACGSAGGVAGHAEATINNRTVFIGSCSGGAFTYHVRLANGAVVVSALSVGPQRLGQKVMEGIRP